MILWNISDASLGTEELGHLEIIGAIVHQLTRNMTPEEVKKAGYETYFVDHTAGVYPTAASGSPWNAASMAVKGDLIADLTEDLAAEQKARVTYDNILRLSDDPDVNDVIKFLRAREIVHFQRFGEGLRLAKEKMDQKNLLLRQPVLRSISAKMPLPSFQKAGAFSDSCQMRMARLYAALVACHILPGFSVL